MIRLTQVNMFEAKTELSRLVKALETKEEDVIFLARNGKPVVQMTRIPEKKTSRRIGVAEGRFTCPENLEETR
ncbi:MAG: hypothetical protein IIU26_03205 [Clostridium sp.]|nr:hypothetical protein [Clostridium sp.]MBQ4148951.1 hypothetical protein [Clostridium sp.]MBQ5421215.1 hypothetical protein [Clostridium sp.]